MHRKADDGAPSKRAVAACVWCKQPFDGNADRKLHISKLGAPGEFHKACFEEYEERARPA